jgi:hypothetical protein
MDARFNARLATLDRGEFLRLDRAHGHTVAVCGGAVWLTQDGDERDVFLRANERFVLEERGHVLIEALAPTQLLVLEPSPTQWRARMLACIARAMQLAPVPLGPTHALPRAAARAPWARPGGEPTAPAAAA